MAGFLLPLLATGISAGGSYLADRLSRRKRPRSVLAEHARAMEEANARTANQNTANAGIALSGAISSRGLSNSGYGLQTLAKVASENAQEATRQTGQGRLGLILADRERQDQYDQERSDRTRKTLSDITQTTAANVAGFGNLLEVEKQNKELLDTIKQLYSQYGEDAPRLFPDVFELYRRTRSLNTDQRQPNSLDQIQQY